MQAKRKVYALLFVSAAIIMCLLTVVLPVSARTPGQAGKIVFVGGDAQSGNFQLFIMNPDGTNQVQITNLPANNFDSLLPNISPDGQRVAFCFGNNSADLYVINIDGTGLVQLTHDGLSCFPRWSPDGTQIIFAHLATNLNFFGVSNNVVTTM
jgi:Tol biopolymer transport system component